MFHLLPSSSRFAYIRVGLAITILIWLASIASAQQTAASLTGEITDTDGSVIPGVSITVKSLETGLTGSAVSDIDGRYVFPSLPIGRYKLEASSTAGFEPYSTEVILTVGETSTFDFNMRPTAGGYNVDILSDPTGINTQTSELSYLVSERAIRDLPLNGRNYTDLAFLQPGIVAYPSRDGGSVVAHGLAASINGQDPRSNVYLLDSTPLNDFTNGPAGSAASTSLGIESIREFRVEANAYSSEYGRNSGGQINVVSKSGTNNFHGGIYLFHRNDNFDARNFFDGADTPEFRRNQFGGSIGGPIKKDKVFFFFGYEVLRESLGKTVTTVVPDANARAGILPGGNVVVSPIVSPYLAQFPLPNGPNLGGGLANFFFGFNQQISQHFLQGRIDYNRSDRDQFFARYTLDDADQQLPTDFPQFPRAFISTNQFFTGEYRQTLSPRTFNTFRLGFSRTRIGQNVQANVPASLQPFIAGREIIGDIDIAGIPRFGPQSSANLRLTQNVWGFEYGMVHSRGRHLLKAGALAEYYQGNMFNPTFSLGIFTFASLSDFLQNRPQRFIGLPSSGALDRYWRFTLFGFYLHDTVRVNSRLSVNAGVRYELTTIPKDINGRDSALINLLDRTPTVGQLYQNPTYKNISPRVGFAWDIFGDGKTSLRGGFGVYFNTNNQQNLIVTVTNPPATPRIIVNNNPPANTNLSFPVPNLANGIGNSIRPVQWNLDNPYVQVWNLNFQRELWFNTILTVGYAGSRGIHLLRSGDVNTPTPQQLEDGSIFYPTGQTRPNTAFSTIELKSSDGNSWYNAAIIEVRKRLSHGLSAQSSYTFSRNIDTTQASTFFSDATNGTTSAFPEPFGLQYNKGLADYHSKHNWVVNFTWDIPFAREMKGVGKTFLDGWQISGIGQVRSGQPLTVFVQRNRSRSQWTPSLGPGIGQDRPNISSNFTHQSAVTGNPNQYFAAGAFTLQPAGFLGSLGRGALIGPNLRTFDLSAVKSTPLSESTKLQLRFEAFNVFNRANFSSPSLTAFSGALATEQPLPTFGQIRSTVTSSRQIQLGVRLEF